MDGIKRNLFLRFLCLSLVFIINNSHGMEDSIPESDFNFKIGLEFQEHNGLCSWAKDNYSIQKKPIFSLNTKEGNLLWELIIDTKDIEFVTPPFSNSERDRALLTTSIKSIDDIMDILKNCTGQLFADLFYELNRFFNNNESNFIFREHQIYGEIRNNLLGIITTGHGKLTFTPQMTIQHPLELTIPLLAVLFGSSAGLPPREMLPILASLPSNARIKSKENVEFDKFDGLIFLHALTLYRLTPLKKNTVIDGINETRENFERYGQIDPKVKLSFLSRRPFSSMWSEIRNSSGSTFEELYKTRIEEGNSVLYRKLNKNFSHLNYGEEYYNIEKTKRLNFLSLLDSFDDSWKNNSELKFLLAKGILTTSMIKVLKKDFPIIMMDGNHSTLSPTDIFKGYFLHTVSSVDKTDFTYRFNSEDNTIVAYKTNSDSLSPCWFVDPDDSMGGYSETPDYYNTTMYGEAIIEMRTIKNLGKYALDAMDKKYAIIRPNDNKKEDTAAAFLDSPENFSSSNSPNYSSLSDDEVKKETPGIEIDKSIEPQNIDYNVVRSYGTFLTNREKSLLNDTNDLSSFLDSLGGKTVIIKIGNEILKKSVTPPQSGNTSSTSKE